MLTSVHLTSQARSKFGVNDGHCTDQGLSKALARLSRYGISASYFHETRTIVVSTIVIERNSELVPFYACFWGPAMIGTRFLLGYFGGEQG